MIAQRAAPQRLPEMQPQLRQQVSDCQPVALTGKLSRAELCEQRLGGIRHAKPSYSARQSISGTRLDNNQWVAGMNSMVERVECPS